MPLRAISALAVVLTTCASGPARAEAADLEGVIVSGRSLEETLPVELSRYGSDLEVVSHQQIRLGGYVDVARALQGVPGLYIRSDGGPFSYVDISIQGSRTQDVLWTMDGIRLNNRLYGSTSPNDTLPALMIERVEVLKGPQGLLYGTQAAAGVINIVTRDFTDDFNGQANVAVDSRGATNLDGFVRGAVGPHKLLAWASRNEADGYRPYSAMQPSATDRKRGYELWSVGGKYQYDFTEGLRLNLQYQHTEAKLDNLSPTRINESRNDRNEEVASVRLDYTGSERVQFFLKGYVHDWKTAYVQILNPIPPGPPVVVYPPGTFWGFRDLGGSALARLSLHRGLDYFVGYEFQSFKGRDDVLLIGKTKEHVHAGVLQVRTNDDFSTRARFAAGLRHNEAEGSDKTVWNVSGRFDISGALYLEGIAGTSFLLPDASSLYQIDPCCEVGNPNLNPEESLNFNATLGGEWTSPQGPVAWKATWFQRRITDLIDIDFDDPLFPDGIYVNVDDEVKVRGFELSANARLAHAWDVSASYAYTRSRNEGAGRQRDRVPTQLGKVQFAYTPEDRPFGGYLAANWIGDTYSTVNGFGRLNYGDYVIWDAGVYAYVDGHARRHRLGLNVENLFDRDYATRGVRSAPADDGSGRFLFYPRGVPQTVRASYELTF